MKTHSIMAAVVMGPLFVHGVRFGLSTTAFAVRPNTTLRHKHYQRFLALYGRVDDGTTVGKETVSESGGFRSRSTNDPELETQFYQGAEDRKDRLHKALESIGIKPGDFLDNNELRGSAALRTYNSFVLPKSDGALAMANQPQRAAVVANSISFLMREHRSHQQEWLRNHDKSLEEAEEQLKGPPNPIALVLDDVRSAHNVGNIIRFAEAARCENVFLCGSMTPAPPHPKVLKTALGAAEYVPYESIGSTLQAVESLKGQGYRVFAVETTSWSVSLWDISFFEYGPGTEKHKHVAFVFGNELVGVDVEILEACDGIVSIPTHGIKNSLNVANCASIVTYEALRQWKIAEGRSDAAIQ